MITWVSNHIISVSHMQKREPGVIVDKIALAEETRGKNNEETIIPVHQVVSGTKSQDLFLRF